MRNDEIKTIVVPEDWSMPYDKETGQRYNPSEVEQWVENGQVLNTDGSIMTLNQYEAIAYKLD